MKDLEKHIKMEKLQKLSLEDLMELIKTDSMPYYWSIPIYAPMYAFTLYEDDYAKMAAYMINKYGGEIK